MADDQNAYYGDANAGYDQQVVDEQQQKQDYLL